jgi:multimeric flavodoxin WrbA
MEPTVVGIAGSIRNRAGLEAVEGVDESVRSQELMDEIRELEHRDIYHEGFLGDIQSHLQDLAEADTQVITNSDALVLASLYGAMGESDTEFHKLTDYIGLDESYAGTHVDSREFSRLAPALREARGVILGTPVYFGDRSSLMHSFIEFAADRGLFEDTVVGVVSCGSKRNGGQETANVYALFESLNHGAVIVGNGPKTCQYGGTGWGGDIGDVADDDFGIETSMGTGLRVSGVANLLERVRHTGTEELNDAAGRPFTVGVLLTRDKDSKLRSTVEETIERADTAGVEFNMMDFSNAFIQACIGCDVCPTPAKVGEITGEEQDYKCIIDSDLDPGRWEKDELQDLHADLMRNDALVVGALDTDEEGIDDVYQTLLERTRYIRRDDWRLHNVPLQAYILTDTETQSTFPLKIMTSWMRHNTVIHPPIVHQTLDSELHDRADEEALDTIEQHYAERAAEQFSEFINQARAVRGASELEGGDKLSYKATGYQNKILDKTTSERS